MEAQLEEKNQELLRVRKYRKEFGSAHLAAEVTRLASSRRRGRERR